jgi:hypothetical protein
MNITALAYNGAFNMVSLTIDAVVIGNIQVSANPQTVDSGGTSDITANVTTTAGTPVPDGTTVNFTANNGGIDPFAQTTNGIADAKFSAPTLEAGAGNETDTITASVGGQQGSTNVTVTAPAAPAPTPTPDTTSPTVSSHTTSLSIAADGPNPLPVSITFSENIDCSTVTPATITITPSVADWAVASCSGATVVFRGMLSQSPPPYTVNVGTGVKDLAGNVAVAVVFVVTVNP